jgi:hypothetical protein
MAESKLTLQVKFEFGETQKELDKIIAYADSMNTDCLNNEEAETIQYHLKEIAGTVVKANLGFEIID